MKKFIPLVILLSAAASGQQLITPEEAVRIALEKNYSIRIANNNLAIAENNTSLGASGFLPDLTSGASYLKTTQTTHQEYFGDRANVDRNNAVSKNLNASIALNWVIFDGLRMFASLSQYKELRNSSELSLKNDIETNVSDIFSAYYSIVRQQKILKLLEYNISLSEERVRIERDKKEVGSSSGFNLRKAEVDLNEDKASYLREELKLVQSKLLLKNLMGMDYDTDFTVTDSIPMRGDMNYDDLLASTEKNNTSIRLADININITNLGTNIARADLFPSISLTGGYNFVKSEAQAGLIKLNRSYGYNYGIQASWNIFNGLNTRRNLENAAVLEENSRISYDQTIDLVRSDLKSTYKLFQNSMQEVNLELQNLKSAEENVSIALERLKLGNISPLEFREAQTDLLDAQNRLISAQVDAKLAETGLLKISGQLIR